MKKAIDMGAIINLSRERTLLQVRLIVAERLLVEMSPQELSVIVYMLCDGSLNRSKLMLSKACENKEICRLFLNYVTSVWYIEDDE